MTERLTLPARLDSSSPPMTLTLLVDLSFWGGAQKWDSIHKLKLPHNESFYQKKKKSLLFQNASALQRFLTRMLSFVLLPTPFPSAHIHEMRKAAYAVALHSNEIHCQRDWFITVLVQWFNVVEEVCKKLVAAFQHTQSYNVVSPHVSNDVAGQALCPASKRRWERETVTAL